MVYAGTFKKDMLVWKQGMSTWMQAEIVQELQPLFVNANAVSTGMPPIPPLI